MGWKDWSYWLRFGLIFALINIFLSSLIFLTPSIFTQSPYGAYILPNILLGIPVVSFAESNFGINIISTITSPLVNKILTRETTDKEGNSIFGSSIPSPDFDVYKTNVRERVRGPFTFFLLLSFYWFIIGAVIGLVYGKIKMARAKF